MENGFSIKAITAEWPYPDIIAGIDTEADVKKAEEFLTKYHEKRQRCEIWTRVMGYHRPTHTFNPGKQSEHDDRKLFEEPR